MLFNKEKIKEALDYYLIKDADYQEKCNICIDEIIRQKNIYIKANMASNITVIIVAFLNDISGYNTFPQDLHCLAYLSLTVLQYLHFTILAIVLFSLHTCVNYRLYNIFNCKNCQLL